MAQKQIEKIDASSLFISEPDPSWFGNPANDLKNESWTNGNWLKSRFHFSFAEYSDPLRSKFGVLRVCNDDLVQPSRGFGTHPHRDMEICTYVVDGELSHEDSMGTVETLGRGSIQFMTAGTGVRHSEFNGSEVNPLRFIQMWIVPRKFGLEPNYGSMQGVPGGYFNEWTHLVSDVESKAKTAVKINQDVNINVVEMKSGDSVDLKVAGGRQTYLLCLEGSVQLKNGLESVQLGKHDAAKLFGQLDVTVHSEEASHLLAMEMKF